MVIEAAMALVAVVQFVDTHHPWAACPLRPVGKWKTVAAPAVLVHVPPCLWSTGMKLDCSMWFGYVGVTVNTCGPLRSGGLGMVSYAIRLEPAWAGRGSEEGRPPRLVVERRE